jgi:thiol:disulfide interchange protein
MKRDWSFAVLAAFAACLLTACAASAQDFDFDDFNFGTPEQFGTQAESATATVTAQLVPVAGSDEVLLSITVGTSADAWTYAIGGESSSTQITTSSVVGVTALEEIYTPDHAPKRETDPITNREMDKFPGGVTWTRHFRLDTASGAEPQVVGEIRYTLCTAATCTQQTETFTAVLATAGAAPSVEDVAAPSETEKPAGGGLTQGYMLVPTRNLQGEQKPDPIRLQFQLEELSADEWELTVIMDLNEGWRTYAQHQSDNENVVPTMFEFSGFSGIEPVAVVEDLTPASVHQSSVPGEKPSNVHHQQAVWSQRFQRVGTDPIGLAGSIRYQLCNDRECLIPKTVKFSLGSLQSPDDIATASAPALAVSNDLQLDIHVPETEASGNLGLQLLLAFLGGMILNVMPCVLPVIAIKILSFVQQAGESRKKVLMLNLSYTAGVLTVFLTLASLAMMISLGWGTQFQNVVFTMSMAAVVFVMALSLLGVFEIPIPGFAGGGEQREGLPGAYMTGIIATLLGVPCTGPLMAAVFAWALKQPPVVTLSVFTSMGLGMASPYFIAGFFPGVVNFLPKPGMWMERFKQFLGFVLMGTVIWLVYVIPSTYQITFMVFLLGLAMGFWMIGSMYNAASPAAQKWRVRLCALFCVGAVSSGALVLQYGSGSHLPWEPFTERRVAELLDEGRPVLIDFTANWCQICKMNEYWALNRYRTKLFVEEHNVATLMADYTQHNPEIKEWLTEFQQDSVPLTVILPPRRGNEPITPITISGPYTQETLLEKLEQAVQRGTQTAQSEAGANEVSQR